MKISLMHLITMIQAILFLKFVDLQCIVGRIEELVPLDFLFIIPVSTLTLGIFIGNGNKGAV